MRNSFGLKLWRWFVLFAAIIFAALWLLQTVFLQSFYDRMAIRGAERAAEEIAEQADGGLAAAIDRLASEQSLLIFLTDWRGTVLYSADEHNSLYREERDWEAWGSGAGNPYREETEPMNWQNGSYRNLPRDYSGFLTRLAAGGEGTVGYTTESGDTYVCGRVLPASPASGGGEAVLYISTPLGAAGAAVGILRLQLIWVTLASLAIAFVLAYIISRQFARPVAAISAQARGMAAGETAPGYQKGFCRELDELSGTLGETAEALGRLENARRELLANVSHDLRTPLTMIKGYAEMVRDISWSDGEKREEDLSIIIREADRLTGLVNDILEYSALQSPELSMERRTVDLSGAARYVAEQFAPLCGRSGCVLETEIEPELWVSGDEEQLKRALYNLMDNALSHAGEGRRVRLSLKEKDAAVCAEIQDDGEGIPEEELPYVWDRYFTAKRRGGRGSGLGLAITKEILLRHGARFGVESGRGQGCFFWFTLERISPENTP